VLRPIESALVRETSDLLESVAIPAGVRSAVKALTKFYLVRRLPAGSHERTNKYTDLNKQESRAWNGPMSQAWKSLKKGWPFPPPIDHLLSVLRWICFMCVAFCVHMFLFIIVYFLFLIFVFFLIFLRLCVILICIYIFFIFLFVHIQMFMDISYICVDFVNKMCHFLRTGVSDLQSVCEMQLCARGCNAKLE
jgi:hypothetical protein